MPHVVFVRAAFLFGLALGLVIEKNENDATVVGYAQFMQSMWTPEVLHEVLVERGPPGASLVGDAEDMENVQTNQNKYWVHDPSDTPTGPEHGWVYTDTTYAPHVHIFEKGEEGHGIECSNSGTTVQLRTNHVENRQIRYGSVLLIESCATTGETDTRDRVVHVGQLLDQDASFTTFSTHPKSLADLADVVERHRIAFHVPVPGNQNAVSSLEEAYAEFQSSGIRTQKNKIHRIKTYAPSKGTDEDLTKAKADPKEKQDSGWSHTWDSGVVKALDKTYSMQGDNVNAAASIQGTYQVSATLGVAVVGECVYTGTPKSLKGFMAYFKGTIDTSATANLTASVNGKYAVPLMPKGMSIGLPVFVSAGIQVSVRMGWDLDLVVEAEGKAEVKTGVVGTGVIKMGAYYNTAGAKYGAQPIHTGQFALEPIPMQPKVLVSGKVALVLDVSFGAEAAALFGLSSAGLNFALTIEPGVYLKIQNCPGKPTSWQQSLKLDVRCGARFDANWNALWGLLTGEKTLYNTGMGTCSVLCFGPCERELVNVECPVTWWEMFLSTAQAGLQAMKDLKKNFKEIAIQAFCDEVDTEKLTMDGKRLEVAGSSHPALSWDGVAKKFTSGGTEAKKYQCTADSIPKELSDIGNDDFVYYPMLKLVNKKSSSALDLSNSPDDYYEE